MSNTSPSPSPSPGPLHHVFDPAPKEPIQSLGRVVIELGTDNKLYMEHYVNGTRVRVKLDRGNELWEIQDALFVQKKEHEKAQARKTEQNEKESRLRHNRVWTHSANARGQGLDFAARIIRGPVPSGYGKPPKTSSTSYGTLFAPEPNNKRNTTRNGISPKDINTEDLL